MSNTNTKLKQLLDKTRDAVIKMEEANRRHPSNNAFSKSKISRHKKKIQRLKMISMYLETSPSIGYVRSEITRLESVVATRREAIASITQPISSADRGVIIDMNHDILDAKSKIKTLKLVAAFLNA